MFKKVTLVFLLVFSISALPVIAQSGQNANEVKRVINKLFELAEKKQL